MIVPLAMQSNPSVECSVNYFLQDGSLDFLQLLFAEFRDIGTVTDRVNSELEILWANVEGPRVFAGCKVRGFRRLMRREPLQVHVRANEQMLHKDPIPMSKILDTVLNMLDEHYTVEPSDFIRTQRQVIDLVCSNLRLVNIPYEVWRQAL